VHACREDGVALILTLLALVLLSALGTLLTLGTSLEATIAGNYRETHEAFYAAEAGLERAMDSLAAMPEWSPAIDGSVQSSFVDGVPAGPRTMPAGGTIDLTEVGNLANCRKATVCTASEMNLSTADRPWGPNNPRWTPFAYGSLRDLLPAGESDSLYYVLVMAADDPSETDNDPLRDEIDPAGAGAGVVLLRAEAFGPRGAHRRVEATIARGEALGSGRFAVGVLSWRHVRD
jgi:Tfp pilus assembly protein PilX